MNNLGEFVSTLIKTQGVSVLTVKDGWVLTFSKDKLKALLEAVGDEKAAIIFVQRSANKPKN